MRLIRQLFFSQVPQAIFHSAFGEPSGFLVCSLFDFSRLFPIYCAISHAIEPTGPGSSWLICLRITRISSDFLTYLLSRADTRPGLQTVCGCMSRGDFLIQNVRPAGFNLLYKLSFVRNRHASYACLSTSSLSRDSSELVSGRKHCRALTSPLRQACLLRSPYPLIRLVLRLVSRICSALRSTKPWVNFQLDLVRRTEAGSASRLKPLPTHATMSLHGL